jgi:hypothetical protein
MVNVKADPGRAFPRKLSSGELSRFYKVLEADLRDCSAQAFCPTPANFRTKYKFGRTFGSFNEAKELYEKIVDSLCRGQEPENL